jgi:DNA-directed RNA polymerase specialized sigma24 family protein
MGGDMAVWCALKGRGRRSHSHAFPDVQGVASDRLAQADASRIELPPAETELAAIELIDGWSDKLGTVAVLKLMEFKQREMAQLLECSERTIDRKIKDIREAWQAEFE